MVICFFLLACESTDRIPVRELDPPTTLPKSYTVQKGDTLYSIAWRFNLDFKRLAANNGIAPPYAIKPGDKIRLVEPVPAKKSAPVPSKVVKKSGNPPEKGVKTTAVSVVEKPIAVGGTWRWPLNGKIIRHFSPKDNLSKGIDIQAVEGDPVVSTRAGTVVYAGSQLKGYGNLIIIRHDDEFLSAYAHNREILVKEGQGVGQGERIAEAGSTGTQSPRLHFEIRQWGKPVDPLQLLIKK